MFRAVYKHIEHCKLLWSGVATFSPVCIDDFVVEQWSWGLLSPQLVQRLMDKAKEDLEAHANGIVDFAEVEDLHQSVHLDLQNAMRSAT